MAANLLIYRTTSFFSDQNEIGIYDPGDVLYTRVTITNDGDANATSVLFEDNFTGSTMVAGTLNISPIAHNDSFTAVGNTVLRVGGAANIGDGPSYQLSGVNLLTNDRSVAGDAVSAFKIDAVTAGSSAKGGTFNIFADGSFNYVNEAGDTGTDSFTYTIRDAGLDGAFNTADDLTSFATVTITLTAEVWYVDASKTTNGTGTSADPFNSMASLNNNADDVDGAGDTIYVKGNAAGPITLEAGQQLVGTGTALVVGGFTLATAGANSSVSATSGIYAITLGSGNTITGIDAKGAGDGISGTDFGTVTINDVAIDVSGQGLNLSTGTIAGAGFNSVDSDGGTNNVSLTAISGPLNLGTGTLSGASGTNFVVTGGSGNITYGGSINDDVGQLINITGRTGGTIDFNGLITDGFDGDGSGISITGNSSGTVRFDGGLWLSTGSSHAFTATGNSAMTLVITDADGAGTGFFNRIATTTGIALNVQNTGIAAEGLTFLSIASNGANNGIVLNNTGMTASNGGLTVTGDSTTSVNTSGGIIQNSVGAGISLTSTKAVSLDQMQISGGGNDGVSGMSVDGFSLTKSSVTSNGNTFGENGIEFSNLTGTATIAQTTVSGSFDDNILVSNSMGSLNLSVTGSTISNNYAGLNDSGLELITSGSANVNLVVNTTNFSGHRYESLEVAHFGWGTVDVQVGITGTASSGGTWQNSGMGIAISNSGDGNLHADVVNATLSNASTAQGDLIWVRSGTAGTGSLTGNIRGNALTTVAENAIDLSVAGNRTTTLAVESNTITNNSTSPSVGLLATASGTGTTNLTIRNNNVTHTQGGNVDSAIMVRAGTASTDTLSLNLNIQGNQATGAAPEIQLLRHSSAVAMTTRLQGYVGLANDEIAIETYVQAQNTASPTNVTASGTGWQNTNSVAPPPAPMSAETAAPIASTEPEKDEEPAQPPAGGESAGEGEVAPAAGPVVVDDGILSKAELDLVVEAAIQRWIAAGATQEQVAAMRAVNVTVSDLGGLKLGESNAGTVTLDDDAAGWRWFVDSTPGDDSEYAGAGTVLTAADSYGQAGTRIDLLTVIMHELGHQIGLTDTYAADERDELMHGTIRAGERRLPGSDDLDAAGGSAVSGAFAIAPLSLGTLEPGRIVTIEWRHTIDSTANGLAGLWTGQSSVDSDQTNEVKSDFNPATPGTYEAESGIVDGLTLGGLIFTDVNKDGDYDSGTDTPLSGVTVTLHADTNGDGDYDPGTDLYVGYNDVNANGVYNAGIDTPAAAGTGTPLTATTGANGLYSFGGLAPGNYIVVVNSTNFNSGNALSGKVASLHVKNPNDTNADGDPNVATPADLNVDDDNNVESVNGAVATRAIRLDYGQEPTAGPNGPALDTNNTLDMAFEQPNQAPAIDLDAGPGTDNAGAYTEHASAQVLAASLLVTDSDDTNLESATVSIGTGFISGADALTLGGLIAGNTGTGGAIAFSYDGTTGVMTLTGSASKADYQAALRMVAFSSTSQEPGTGRAIAWKVNDGDLDSATATTTVTVTSVNDAPAMAAPTEATIGWTENTSAVALMQGVVLSDLDAPANFAGGSLTIDVSGGEGGINFKAGSLFSVSSGRLIYNDGGTPRDLGAISLIGTTNVAVTALTAEATLARLNDLVDDFTFYIFGDSPTAGDRTVTMSFDDGGNSGSGGAKTAVRTQTLTVTAVEDPPVVGTDTASTDEATAIVIDVLANDSDLDGPTPAVASVDGEAIAAGETVTLASGAKVTLGSDGKLTYDPNGAFDHLSGAGSGGTNTSAVNSFSYGLAGGGSGTVNVTVSGLAGSNDVIRGSSGPDTLRGGPGTQYLVGGAGDDDMAGGTGDDTYYVDSAGDVVNEAPGEGRDRVAASVSYALAAGTEIELLEAEHSTSTDAIDLTGNEFANAVTGNAGVNRLRGGGGDDILAGLGGNDVLIGGAGNDVMDGGSGDDNIYVDDSGDFVIEATGGGTDRVAASVSYVLSPDAEIELIEVKDLSSTDAINLTGSNSANTIYGNYGQNFLDGAGGDDVLYGLDGDDYLIGGSGNDTLWGGTGDDTYYVADAGDAVREWGGEGRDRVATAVSYTLTGSSEIEVLEAINSADTTAIDLTGNEFANTLIGNAGSNVLDGKGGSDVLFGNGGADSFAFTTALGSDNVDHIDDFDTAEDNILLGGADGQPFAGLGSGQLDSSAFTTGSEATDASHRIVYNPETGALFYDAYGAGGAAAVQFATVKPGTALTAEHFVVTGAPQPATVQQSVGSTGFRADRYEEDSMQPGLTADDTALPSMDYFMG